MKNAKALDKKNYVVKRLKHNYVCISHYPTLPAKLSVVPYTATSSIQYLPKEEFRENMAIAYALLPIMKKYAQEHIRECDGANLYTKSLGAKASDDEKQTYHVHTRVIPRTTVPLTPGNHDNNSRKLDFDPDHLFAYLKKEFRS